MCFVRGDVVAKNCCLKILSFLILAFSLTSFANLSGGQTRSFILPDYAYLVGESEYEEISTASNRSAMFRVRGKPSTQYRVSLAVSRFTLTSKSMYPDADSIHMENLTLSTDLLSTNASGNASFTVGGTVAPVGTNLIPDLYEGIFYVIIKSMDNNEQLVIPAASQLESQLPFRFDNIYPVSLNVNAGEGDLIIYPENYDAAQFTAESYVDRDLIPEMDYYVHELQGNHGTYRVRDFMFSKDILNFTGREDVNLGFTVEGVPDGACSDMATEFVPTQLRLADTNYVFRSYFYITLHIQGKNCDN